MSDIEARHDRPRLNLEYVRRLRKWKVSESYEMVEEMIEMWRNRKERVGEKTMNLLGEASQMKTLAILGPRLGGLEEELARVRPPVQSRELLLQEQELIRDLGLEQEWEKEKEQRKREWEREKAQRERERARDWGRAQAQERGQERELWGQERGRWEQVLVLGLVQEHLKQSRPQRIQQETRGRLLHLVDIRQAQLMEPWRKRKELHDGLKVLQEVDRDLDQALPQMRMVSALLLLSLSPSRGRLALGALGQLPQGDFAWEQLDRLVAHWGRWDWSALGPMEIGAIRARLRPTAIQGQKPLLDVIKGNHSKFVNQSSYLDALLVFVGVISFSTYSRKY